MKVLVDQPYFENPYLTAPTWCSQMGLNLCCIKHGGAARHFTIIQHREDLHKPIQETDVDFGCVNEQEPSYKWRSVLVPSEDPSVDATAANSLLSMYI